MTSTQATRPLPSVPEFRGLPATEQREIYMRAYKALCAGRVPNRKKRKRLLAAYQEAAGFDCESIRTMRAVVQTPI